MGKKNEPTFTYNAGRATCEAQDRLGRKFVGKAKCHVTDRKFESELTGCTIAEMRANIEALKAYRNDCKVRLGALNQLYYSMKQSKQFNPKSYENKMLWRQIRLTKDDLAAAQSQLSLAKLELKEYLESKDKLHKEVRKKK